MGLCVWGVVSFESNNEEYKNGYKKISLFKILSIITLLLCSVDGLRALIIQIINYQSNFNSFYLIFSLSLRVALGILAVALWMNKIQKWMFIVIVISSFITFFSQFFYRSIDFGMLIYSMGFLIVMSVFSKRNTNNDKLYKSLWIAIVFFVAVLIINVFPFITSLFSGVGFSVWYFVDLLLTLAFGAAPVFFCLWYGFENDMLQGKIVKADFIASAVLIVILLAAGLMLSSLQSCSPSCSSGSKYNSSRPWEELGVTKSEYESVYNHFKYGTPIEY